MTVSQELVLSRPKGKIFRNEAILLYPSEPIPELINSNLLKRMKENLDRFLQGRLSPNLLLFGTSGSGKTTLVQRLVSDLSPDNQSVRVFVDCWRYYTRMAVYSLIAQALGEMLPRRGLATDEVFDRILQNLKSSGRKVIIVLDEIDGLLFNHQEHLLFDFANAGSGQYFCFVGICNDPKGFSELDEGLKTSLRLEEIEMPLFTKDNLMAILKERAEKALKPGSFSEPVLRACVEQGLTDGHSAKVVLETLWKAALSAENDGRSEINLKDVYGKEPPVALPKTIQDQVSLSREEQLIVSILSNGSASSTRLYDEFQQHLSRTKRQIRNYLDRLAARKIISMVEQPDSAYFLKTRLIRLNCQHPINLT